MNNKLLIRAITVLNNAGFEVLSHAEQDAFTVIGISHDVKDPVSELKEFGTGYNFVDGDSGISRLPGETWDLASVMDESDWRKALKALRQMIRNGLSSFFNIGDFIHVSFEVPATEHQGVKFGKLKVENAKVQIVEILSDRVIFNFDEILFKSAINAADSNEGGFMDSALSHYLNTEINDAMGISDLLITNHDGMNYSLLTAYELFGKSEYWESKTNWNNEQMPYFKNEKNRIKVLDNETCCYWTSSTYAAAASSFCSVDDGGYARAADAGYAGGCAPAFCVA
jgi:hypothetical protein